MKNRYFYSIIFFLTFSILFAQETSKMIKKADRYYNSYGFFNSMSIYEKVANKGYKSVELFEKLGNSNYFNGFYVDAYKWYSQLFALSEEVDPVYFYRYSQTLKIIGDNYKAIEYLEKFNKLSKNKLMAVNYPMDSLVKSTLSYSIDNLGINSSASDFGSSLYKNQLVFTSTRKPNGFRRSIDPWTSDYFSYLYSVALLNNDEVSSNVTVFSKDLNIPYHVSTPVFTKDGATMYFSSSNILSNKELNSDKPIMLKIYKASLKNGKWGSFVDLSFNNDAYNTAHPALSPDESTLFFVSDNPSGYGGNDIYKVDILGDNLYGIPQNLGPNINTAGKESFPFISVDEELFFSSDGHFGYGALDVFVTNIKDKIFTNKILNLGKTINSSFDDFCFFKLPNVSYGFFSSNRLGGSGKDDVYRFKESKEIKNIIKLEGTVIDHQTRDLVFNPVISLFDKNHAFLSNVPVDKNGKYAISVDQSKGPIFYVEVKLPDYETEEVEVLANEPTKFNVISLLKKNIVISKNDDLSKTLLQPIYFDLDKYSINKITEIELVKLIELLNQFPEMRLLISCHTDSRYDYGYNFDLSNKRANAIKTYLVRHGIESSRLVAQGLGESQLLNNCADGVKCTEDQHKVNRRCEFIIL